MAWSYDCTLLAYAGSTGTVRVFDLMGSELFVITMVGTYLKLTTVFFECLSYMGTRGNGCEERGNLNINLNKLRTYGAHNLVR